MVVLLSFSNFKISFILSADIPFKCKSFICDANFSKEPPAYKLARPPSCALKGLSPKAFRCKYS